MLTLQDCLDMSDLAPEVIEAIADQQHLPSILAAELGECLACSAGGRAVIHGFLLDSLTDAHRRSDGPRIRRLETALDQFRIRHPGVG